MNASAACPRTTTSDSVLNNLIDELTAKMQAGVSVDLEAVVAEHPDHVETLRRLLPALQVLADLSQNGEPGALATGDSSSGHGTLGDFRLIREVGRGGMGVVYEAEQISLRRRVALKVLPFAGTLDPRHLQRFKNEAQAAAHLHHTNIVPVYFVGSERGVHYYAMQFIDGRTLADVIRELRQQAGLDAAREPNETADLPLPDPSPKRGGEHDSSPPSRFGKGAGGLGLSTLNARANSSTERSVLTRTHFRTVAQWGIQAAEALDHAHEQGIVHRDIKPANLLLDAGSHLWITDFGLAHCLSDAALTMSGDLIGTLRYMSPEQALAKRVPIDHRTDIYSLGATLYELLTLRPVVDGRDRSEILRQLTLEEARPLRKWNKSIPPELETIVLKALEKSPESRYASAQELADDLRRFTMDEPIRAKPPGWREKIWKWSGRHRIGITVAASFFVLAAIGFAISAALLAKKESDTSQANARAQGRLAQLERANEFLDSVFNQIDPTLEEKGGLSLREQMKDQLLSVTRELDGEAIGDELVVAKLQTTLGMSLNRLGEHRQAVDLLSKASATLNRLLGPDDPGTYIAINNLALTYADSGMLPEAIRAYEQAYAGLTRTLGTEDTYTLKTLSSLGVVYARVGQLPEANRILKQAHEAQSKRFGVDHESTMQTVGRLALELVKSGKAGEAIPLYERVRDAEMAKFGADHPRTQDALVGLAQAYLKSGKMPQAIRILEPLRDVQVTKLGRDHPWTMSTIGSLAYAYQKSGRLPEAIRLFEQVRDARIAKLGPDHPSTLSSLNLLASAFDDSGNLPQAIRLHEQVREGRAAKLGVDHPDTLISLNNLAGVYQKSGKLQDASRLYDEAVGGIERRNFQHEYAGRIVNNAAGCFDEVNDHEKADSWRRKWLAVAKERSLEDTQDTATALRWLASNLIRTKKFTEAEELLRKCLKYWDRKEPDIWRTFYVRSILGSALLGQQKYAEAESLLVASYQGLQQRAEKIPAADRTKRLIETLDPMIELYEQTARPDEAAKCKAERAKLSESSNKDSGTKN